MLAGTKTVIIEGISTPPILQQNVGDVSVRMKNCNDLVQVTAVLWVPSSVTCGIRNCANLFIDSLNTRNRCLASHGGKNFRHTNKQTAFHCKYSEGMNSSNCWLLLLQRVRLYCCYLLWIDMKIMLYGGSFSESKKKIISWVMANTLSGQDNSRVQRGQQYGL